MTGKGKIYPEDYAEVVWEKDGITYSIVKSGMGHYCGHARFMGHYCGYARFKERPLKEKEYDGIVTYVPVHGGITFARQDERGFTYGFDCAHAGDEYRPELKDIEWLKKECEKMAIGIKVAKEFEDRYLLAENNEKKAEIIDEYHAKLKEKHGIEFKLKDNFEAMLNALFGKL